VALTKPSFDGIWLWGFTDRHTWVKHFYDEKEDPCIFDKYYSRKEAYFGLREALETITIGGTVGGNITMNLDGCCNDSNNDIDNENDIENDNDREEAKRWGHTWRHCPDFTTVTINTTTTLTHSKNTLHDPHLVTITKGDSRPDWELDE